MRGVKPTMEKKLTKMKVSNQSGYTGFSIFSLGEICLEEVTDGYNLEKALKCVARNKGAPGMDGVETKDYALHRQIAGFKDLIDDINAGTYRPKPVKRVYIPKENGDKRPLGIPTVEDRVVQQALANILSKYYEEEFSDNSFGYRPGRGCRQAVKRALKYVNSGKQWVIDLDLSKFFDTVNHSKLLQILSEKIKDGRVISLIHKFLRTPIYENGVVSPKSKQGTPQGGPVSPILANIILNECDQMMDKENIKFVRYADDMMIFCKSKEAAERTLNKVTKFLEKTLFLTVNKEKTKILWYTDGTQFLGFTLSQYVPKHIKQIAPKCKVYVKVHPKKREKFQKGIKETLDRRAPGGIEETKKKFNQKIRGWFNYFKGSIPQKWMEETDAWMRRRIRQMYWKQWKTPQNRMENFSKLNPKSPSRRDYAYSNNSYWRMAMTKQMHNALSNRTLTSMGWLSLQELNAQYLQEMSGN